MLKQCLSNLVEMFNPEREAMNEREGDNQFEEQDISNEEAQYDPIDEDEELLDMEDFDTLKHDEL